MKKLFLITSLAVINLHVSAQYNSITEDANGNIGIGIGQTAPVARLDVNGDIHSRAALLSQFHNAGIGGHLVLVNPAKTTAGSAIRWTIYNMDGNYGNSLQFWAYDQAGCGTGLCHSRFVLMDNGNVGIGVDNPQAKLAVAGGIVATKIKVSQNLAWPDYVFEPGYRLPSLYELDQFIRQNKHLPGIPSAAAVAADGIDLGDNQAALLKKIEELTLYIIDMKKEMDEMKKKIGALHPGSGAGKQ